MSEEICLPMIITDEVILLAAEAVFILSHLVAFLTVIFPLPYGRYAYYKLSGWSLKGVNLWRCFSVSWIIPIFIAVAPGSLLGLNMNTLAVSLYVMHYFYRSIIYSSLFMQNSSPWPMEMAVVAVTCAAFNGFVQVFHLFIVSEPLEQPLPVLVLGLVIFLVGFYINVSHDKLLSDLRKNARNRTEDREIMGETHGNSSGNKYHIPRGQLFEYISAANYSGEIMEWWGFALFTQGGLPQVFFAIFTTVIIGVRGWQHHQFYKKTFPSYPKKRKALIPFIL